MKFSYKISQEAKQDLQRIYEYGFINFGEQQADSYFSGLFEVFEKIAANPFRYESVDHIRQDYRRCPYISDTIYFRMTDQEVQIMAIIGGQDTDNWI